MVRLRFEDELRDDYVCVYVFGDIIVFLDEVSYIY